MLHVSNSFIQNKRTLKYDYEKSLLLWDSNLQYNECLKLVRMLCINWKVYSYLARELIPFLTQIPGNPPHLSQWEVHCDSKLHCVWQMEMRHHRACIILAIIEVIIHITNGYFRSTQPHSIYCPNAYTLIQFHHCLLRDTRVYVFVTCENQMCVRACVQACMFVCLFVNNTYFGNRDGLLFHHLVDGCSVTIHHLVKLINTTDALVSQHEGTTL